MIGALRAALSHPVGVTLLFLIVTAALIVGVVRLPPLLIDTGDVGDPKERLKAINDLRGTLVTVLGGVAIAAGTVVAALNLRETQRRQIADRFGRAIDQLGNPATQIRVGGIYALEQVACDSRELYHPVLDVRCAFVRDVATESRAGAAAGGDLSAPPDAPAEKRTRPDVQAALTVIGRRTRLHRLPRYEPDLHGVALRGYSFGGATLDGANFEEADLQESTFEGASLRETSFSFANVRGAAFGLTTDVPGRFRTDLTWAFFVGANVTDAEFYGAELAHASFGGDPQVPRDLTAIDAKGLTRRQLEHARGYDTVLLPTYLRDRGDTPREQAVEP